MSFPSIKASAKSGKDFELIPPGIHFAICTQVIHLGVQPGGKYPDRDQVYLRFEIPGVRVKWEKNGKEFEGPAMIGTFFTLSIGEKSNLRPFLEGWRGRPFTKEEEEGFEITSILGKVCQLNVIPKVRHDGKESREVKGAFGLIQEQKDKLQKDPSLGQVSSPDGLIAYTPDQHDQKVWDKLPDWIHEKINARVKPAAGPDYANASQAPTKPDFDDDIPF